MERLVRQVWILFVWVGGGLVISFPQISEMDFPPPKPNS